MCLGILGIVEDSMVVSILIFQEFGTLIKYLHTIK